MPLVLALAPAILQALMQILGWVAKKKLNKQQQEEFFTHWKSMARTLNLTDLVAKREMAEDQLQANNDAWDKIEAAEKNEKAP